MRSAILEDGNKPLGGMGGAGGGGGSGNDEPDEMALLVVVVESVKSIPLFALLVGAACSLVVPASDVVKLSGLLASIDCCCPPVSWPGGGGGGNGVVLLVLVSVLVSLSSLMRFFPDMSPRPVRIALELVVVVLLDEDELREKNLGKGGAGGGMEKPGERVEKLFGEFCD